MSVLLSQDCKSGFYSKVAFKPRELDCETTTKAPDLLAIEIEICSGQNDWKLHLRHLVRPVNHNHHAVPVKTCQLFTIFFYQSRYANLNMIENYLGSKYSKLINFIKVDLLTNQYKTLSCWVLCNQLWHNFSASCFELFFSHFCAYCSYQATRPSHIRKHIHRVHPDIKEYQCPFPNCSKCFVQKVGLEFLSETKRSFPSTFNG